MEENYQIQLQDLKIDSLETIQSKIDNHALKAFNQKEHIIIGISPANGYFTYEIIEKLTTWALSEFNKVTFIDPSDIYRYTLNARESPGVDSQIEKATKQFQKKVKQALKVYLNISQMEEMDKIYDEIKLLGTKMEFCFGIQCFIRSEVFIV
ncbi:hypothetical protein IMG5_081850 [Ichthyophthirius multifiliis]|uniref:Uncharacterized protein n=1 Tax=Ichthyophthirius multifiliis TaxID=5932 RepID=G0QQN8_ICHMU|nr:hypothetical protein IMG5_081850 [Ichthyophthirius multifiliis]EGR32470.1 hypothetical protein IMG5_081850 [Ichthyophthirius multifiliis]|eukprot:XP_004036456.1 hypothetical protein IMG5_081850 [Ichthyophthirius multifiliis]